MKKRLGLLTLFFLSVALKILLLPPVLPAQDGNSIKEVMNSALFIYEPSASPCDEVPRPVSQRKMLRPIGSGFIVGLRPPVAVSASESTEMHKFLITAEHVIGNRNAVIVRLNRRDKPEFACFTLRLVKEGKNRNVFLSDRAEADLAAIRIPDFPDTHPVVFDDSMVLDEDLMKKEEVREGTDVFTVGYLVGYAGIKQNYPAVKFGKVVTLSDETWYHSEPPRNMDEQAYLIELQSEPGLSGAPVILQSPQLRKNKDGSFQYRAVKPYIIGVLKGGLRSLIGGSQGITAIEPAYRLRELLKKIAHHPDPE